MAPEFIKLSTIPHVQTDLRYASTNNFMNENVYGTFTEAYLHQFAAEKLLRASKFLQEEKPGFALLVLDALRPRSAQRKLFAKVKGTPEQKYVADPDKGSLHNYGFAVDLTIVDSVGNELDMGSGFDDFRPVSEPSREAEFLESGELSDAQIGNRLLLRGVMQKAGFQPIPHEWWHFNAMSLIEARTSYSIVE
jgi:zinc D-Ala-D-Ala dipeptidase